MTAFNNPYRRRYIWRMLGGQKAVANWLYSCDGMIQKSNKTVYKSPRVWYPLWLKSCKHDVWTETSEETEDSC